MIHDLAKKRGTPITKVSLWEAKWHEKALRKRCSEISIRSFDKGYRQKPISDMEFMFPSFISCIKYGVSIEMVAPRDKLLFVSTGIDLSSRKRQGNVIVTIGVREDFKRVPLDIRLGNWTSPQTAYQLAQVYANFRPHVIMVENNAYQGSIIEWIQSLPEQYNFWNIIMAYNTGKQKWTDTIGLPSLESEFSTGSWIIPFQDRHLMDCTCSWCRWVGDMGIAQYFETEVSDLLMATWFSREGIRLYSRSMDFEDTIEIPETVDELGSVFGILNVDLDDFEM